MLRALVVSGSGPLSAMQELFCEMWFMLKIVKLIGPYVLNAIPRELAMNKELMDVGIYALMPALGSTSSSSPSSIELALASMSTLWWSSSTESELSAG